MTGHTADTMAVSDTRIQTAQRVRALAVYLGSPLDEQDLALLDEHDLHTLHDLLRQARDRHAGQQEAASPPAAVRFGRRVLGFIRGRNDRHRDPAGE